MLTSIGGSYVPSGPGAMATADSSPSGAANASPPAIHAVSRPMTKRDFMVRYSSSSAAVVLDAAGRKYRRVGPPPAYGRR